MAAEPNPESVPLKRRVEAIEDSVSDTHLF